ncbi:hypothetical protein ABCR94_26300 [Streptomyces sp. 21So2-11]|uniref:hypothetical protein n=1 Tax=Streptomyces sp. 21So2-11 TaxID=3144408 RepID=UPI00321A9368
MMLITRQRTNAACLAAAGLLAISACSSDGSGGSDASDSGKISGADVGESKSPSADPSTSDTPEKGAPAFDLPQDVTVAIEKAQTGDPKKDEVLRDVGYAAKAQIEAFAKGDGYTANMQRYYTGLASPYWGKQIKKYRDRDRTVTGQYEYYGLQVRDLNGKVATARYCEDQRKAFGKEIKSGKVIRTKSSKDAFVETKLEAQKNAKGDWQVRQFEWKKAAESCVRG